MTSAASPFRRRTFLATVATGALAVSGAARAAAAVPPGLRRSSFAPQIGRTFSLAGASGSNQAVLEEVRDLAGAAAGSERAFTLAFRCAPGATVADGSFVVSRAGTSTTLFLGAVERGLNGPLLEAVVHQL